MTDGDPRNDFVVTYSLRVTAQIPTSGVFVGVSGGVLERFVTQPDESGAAARFVGGDRGSAWSGLVDARLVGSPSSQSRPCRLPDSV